ncbi:YhcH/YjgK/YiaL family protein [Streptococcus sanguinis]|uniref:YhcH/YjgK/YiaL family protein n=1 Tax=Streptococcus sanguinis TaxID=1305 RepID=UPI001D153FE9|nr:YhcH/YjgK/YiaL family protein [Streptococcus sanguinis]MCC3167997.1 hypothetical protein [Streptococcus sanguinis]
MIVTEINNLSTYVGVNPYFERLINFLKTVDLGSLPEGKIDIEGDELFGNCFSYVADGQPGDFFETHRKYLDIHLVLENTEDMAVSSVKSTTVSQPYNKEKDIELYEGKVEQLIHLKSGECLITFPEDLHQPKVRVNDLPLKKVVFKVAIS